MHDLTNNHTTSAALHQELAQLRAELAEANHELYRLRARLGELDQERVRQLRRSEAQLRALLNNSQQAFVLYDSQLRVVAFNTIADERSRRLLGYPMREGDPAAAFVTLEQRPLADACLEKALQGVATRIDLAMQLPDGNDYWFALDYTPVFADDGEVLGICVSAIDINSRVKATQALAQSEERFRALVQNSSDMIMVLSATGLLRYASPALEHVLSHSQERLRDRPLFDLLHPDDLFAARAALEELVLQHGMELQVTVRMRHANGSWVYVEAMCLNMLSHVSIGGIVVNARDISERRRLEAQLFHSQKMESIGRLAGGVAHDFNNLLTAIGGYADLAINALPTTSEVYADLVEIRRAADRATALTRQLLAFARKQVVAPRLHDLNSLVLHARKLLERLLGEHVVLELHLAPGLATVLADAGQIEQVLINLVVNARDAMPEGGSVLISTERVIGDGSKQTELVRLQVSDNGPGIPAEVQQHLFEPFFTTKDTGKGTGLGLATSYGIVQQHGGSIGYSPRAGGGTVMTVDLPATAAPADDVSDLAPSIAATFGSETLLVVEDEPAVRALAVRVLRAHGYRVLEASNGLEALTLFHDPAQPPIDLLLTDIVMPQMGGYKLAERVAQLRPSVPVLLMTGYSELPWDAPAALRSATVVQKPFAPAALARTVRALLDTSAER